MTERGSDHHAPRVDDALARETASLTHGAPVEARAQEWHQMEAPADGEPVPDARNLPGDSGVEDRSRLAASLRPSSFPADREVLLRVAREEHAGADVITWLEALPAGRTFDNVQAVWSALGHEVEVRTPGREPSDSRERELPSLPARAASVGTAAALAGVGFAVQAASAAVRVVRRMLRR